MHSPDDSAAEGELQQIVDLLTPLQQDICRGLMDGMSICQIAVLTGRHYTTIRRHACHIRQAFANRGYNLWSA
jgi:DNA-binding NarL/FixJ family response regulator